MNSLRRFIARALGRRPRILGALGILLGCWFAASAHAAPTLYMTAGGIGHLSGLWTVDTATGLATYVGPCDEGTSDTYIYAGGLAWDTTTHKLYASGATFSGVTMLYTLDPATGAATVVGSPGPDVSLNASSLALDNVTHTMYASCQYTGGGQHSGLFTLNTSNGAATLIGSTIQAGAYIDGGMALSPATGILYANGTNDFLSSGSKLLIMNKGSGAETVIGSHGIALGRQMFYGGLAFHPLTGVLYGVGSVTSSLNGLYTVNPATGAATLVGSFAPGTGGSDGGLTFIPYAITGVGGTPSSNGIALHQNVPNPFNPTTTISFTLPARMDVTLSIYDVEGARVATLFHGTLDAGNREVTWNGRDSRGHVVSSGMYLYRLTTGQETLTKKMVLLK